MANPAPEGDATRSLREQMVESMLFSDSKNGVDVLFSFDTTGSMYAVLGEVRKRVTDTVNTLLQDIPNIRIGIIGHGDYCDGNVITKLDFSSDAKQITEFVNKVPCTGGGDYPEAYEYVLREAQKFSWKKLSAKALVLIGDAPPHPPSMTDQDIWWRDELTSLYRNYGIKIYSVQGYPNPSCTPFYQECARRTGGVYLELNDFNLITDMFQAVCYRQKSKEALKRFREKANNKNLDAIFDKLEQELPPPPLGQYAGNWWSMENDKSTRPQYQLEKGKFTHYTGSGKVVKKKEERSMEADIRKSIATADFSTNTTRVGSSILDDDRRMKPAAVAEKKKAKKVYHDPSPYVIKEVKPGVFEFVRRDSVEGEMAALIEAEVTSPPQDVPAIPVKVPKSIHLQLTFEQRRDNAIKRLMRDLLEVKRIPIHNISALPLEDNMLEWHCNLAGPASSPYKDSVFHLILNFSIKYPRRPPSVTLCTRLLHDNVFGQWVCLDMLELGGWAGDERNRMFTGWSYGYSVLSVLLQLQAFLFEGAYSESHAVAESTREAKAFQCDKCGHQKEAKGVFPPLPDIEAPTAPEKKSPDTSVDKSETSEIKKQKKAAKKAEDAASQPSISSQPAKMSPIAPEFKSAALATNVAHWSDLRVGQEVIGQIQRILPNLGAFVQIGKAPTTIVALLHASQIAGPRAAECVTHNIARFYVRSLDLETGKVGLSLEPSPSRTHFDQVQVDDVYTGVVRRVMPYGAFLDINVFAEPREVLQTEDESREVDQPEEKTPSSPSLALSPSSSQTYRGPRFVRINALMQNHEIGGYVHVWSAQDVIKIGDRIKVKVIKLDTERRRIWASSKVLEEQSAQNERIEAKANGNTSKALQKSSFALLSVQMIFDILRYLNPITAQNFGYSCKMFNRIAADGMSFLWERKELICFYSKRHFSDDTLGVGLNLESKLNGKLAYITTTFDLVSREAFFNEKVRKAVYKEPFTHWLPLFINKDHGKESIPLAKEAMAKICMDAYGHFEPWMVIEVIPKLMNSMVVQVMSGKLFASVMALEGYCAFHHLFLMLLEEYPELKQKVDDTIKIFITDDRQRHKRIIPSLGEWIPLLTVTETYSWRDVAVPYLLEMFDRNVLWTLKKHPELMEWSGQDYEPSVRDARLRKTFDATTVSNHLIMFHVYFLDKVARPPGMNLAQVREILDLRYGKPTFPMKDQLMRECKRIRKVSDWEQFFKYIKMPAPNKDTLTDWLYSANNNSAKVGYHRPWQFRKELEQKRAEATETRTARKEAAVVDKAEMYEELYGWA